MPNRVCLECRQITSKPSRRGLCPDCDRMADASRPTRAVYNDPRWRRLSAQAVRAWVRAHGWVCPGYGREAHPAYDLTGDHIVPVSAGGAPFDPTNVGVLCRSCNGRKAHHPATIRSTDG